VAVEDAQDRVGLVGVEVKRAGDVGFAVVAGIVI